MWLYLLAHKLVYIVNALSEPHDKELRMED